MDSSSARIEKDDANEDQSVRCLRLVHYLYHAEIAPAGELISVLGTREAHLQADIETLRRGGIHIETNANGQFAINHCMPGFSLRLTRLEAAIVWARFWYCSMLYPDNETSVETLKEVSALLKAGLYRYHPDSEGLARQPDAMLHHLAIRASARQVSPAPSSLSGTARRVFRRLRIFDLVEAGKARHRHELVALLGESDRTIGNDLSIMRQAGLGISYARSGRTYFVRSLHTYLSRKLTRRGFADYGRILMQMLASCNLLNAGRYQTVADCVSEKILSSMQLIYGPVARSFSGEQDEQRERWSM